MMKVEFDSCKNKRDLQFKCIQSTLKTYSLSENATEMCYLLQFKYMLYKELLQVFIGKVNAHLLKTAIKQMPTTYSPIIPITGKQQCHNDDHDTHSNIKCHTEGVTV